MHRTIASWSLRHLFLGCGLLAALHLSACAPLEPINGCTLAAANQREILRAHAFLHPTIPARILTLHYPGNAIYHAALIYRLPEGWCAYDDTFGTRQLHLAADSTDFPPALLAARAASPGRSVDAAQWLENSPRADAAASSGFAH